VFHLNLMKSFFSTYYYFYFFLARRKDLKLSEMGMNDFEFEGQLF
jgi:hypothetical protein